MRLNSSYQQTFIFLCAIILGAIVGGLSKTDWVLYFKPIAQIFLNFLICVMLPFVFFSVSHAVSKMQKDGEFARLFGFSLMIFVLLGIGLSILSMTIVSIFPIHTTLALKGTTTVAFSLSGFLDKCVDMFSVDNFYALWSSQHLLALMLFAILFGISASRVKNQHQVTAFLAHGEHLFKGMFDLIMYFAPLAFFIYFANISHEIGANLFSAYFWVGVSYYLTATLYVFFGFTVMIIIVRGHHDLQVFWQNISIPAMMALGTCSSVACIPANIQALKKMGCQTSIAESILPLATLIHKQGSIIGGVFKIAFLFTVFHLDFNGLTTLALAIFISMMVGTVMGAIPGGGMLGELLILSVYGFPKEALILVAAISMIIDPIATLLNVTGNTMACLIIDAYFKTQNNTHSS
ncbi:MAG: dicarboxylate/amino acid:cation symporter [Gammaproteobacteria bacterium]|nr:dicarboxylate/amino acid:cation symporter [Gammaproteobacteria bacterium]